MTMQHDDEVVGVEGVGDALPDGWAWATLGEIADLVGGGTPSRQHSEYFTGNIIWLTPTEIPKHRVAVITDSKERITEEALRHSSARLLPEGTVLMTSRASIGYVAIAGTEVTTNQGFASFICKEGVYNAYLAYWLWGNAEFFEQEATGTTFKEISKTKLRTFIFPLAPSAEQKRIVEAIEGLFTQLDAGVAALKRLRANLRRYKAAVLKAACEGRLVPQDPDDEPASELLGRILAERRAKWAAEQRAKGKDPRKVKYEEPATPDTSDLPELPEGWVWASLESISNALGGYAFNSSEYTENGFQILKIGNVKMGRLILSEHPTFMANVLDNIQQKYLLQKRDIVITLTGTRKKRDYGYVALVNDEEKLLLNQRVARLRFHMSLNPQYFLIALQNENYRDRFFAHETGNVGQGNVGMKAITKEPIPIPPINEQDRLVSEVDGYMTIFNQLEISLQTNLQRTKRLRQAILKQAFAGQLVAQDPDDEPASELLKRVRRRTP